MRTIRISNEVWQEIANRGRFGETEDTVLRRVFGLDQAPNDITLDEDKGEHSKVSSTIPNNYYSGQRQRLATRRLSPDIQEGKLTVSFQGGPSKEWDLPAKSDKNGIRLVRDEAVKFANENGATLGQRNAVKKALTDEGYWVSK